MDLFQPPVVKVTGDQQQTARHGPRYFPDWIDRRECRAADKQHACGHQHGGESMPMFAKSAPPGKDGNRRQREEKPGMGRLIDYPGDRQQGGHPGQQQAMDQADKREGATQKIRAEPAHGSREHKESTELQQCCILYAPIVKMQLCCVCGIAFLPAIAAGALDIQLDGFDGETRRNLLG